ncbi:MAG TPA: GAF domain-containing protein, partial [Xanthomonadales bacterium]|nr:GAF domain-containing protein [Xanthomonadales bacterium]
MSTPAPVEQEALPTSRRVSLLERQTAVLKMIAADEPLKDVLEALCRIAEDYASQRVHAAILLVDQSRNVLRPGAAPSLPEDYSSKLDGVPVDPAIGTCARAAALREVVVTPDIAAAPGWAAICHLPASLGLRAAWSMPIVSSTGTVLGTFGTYFRECRGPDARERELVAVLSHTAALAIERRRTDEALRTRERELAVSEARHRAMFQANPECVKIIAGDGTTLAMNASGLRLLGLPEES